MKADAALPGTARGAVLDAPAVVHLDLAGVHADGHRDFEDPLRGHDPLDQPLVQTEQMAGRFDQRRDAQPRIELVRGFLIRTRDHVVTSL